MSVRDAISLRWQMFGIFKFRQIRGKDSARVVNKRHRGLGSLVRVSRFKVGGKSMWYSGFSTRLHTHTQLQFVKCKAEIPWEIGVFDWLVLCL